MSEKQIQILEILTKNFEVSTLQSNIQVTRIVLTSNSSYAEYLDGATIGLNSKILRENGHYIQVTNWCTNPNMIDKAVFQNLGVIPVLTTTIKQL